MRNVNGVRIQTLSKEFIDCNILKVEVGTNGYMGGDTGHGSRTYFRLSDLGGTDIEVKSYGDDVEISLGGDAELTTFIKALKFAIKILESQAGE